MLAFERSDHRLRADRVCFPLLGNDVGIMYAPAPSGAIVMAVFTNDNRGNFFDLEATEGKAAEDVLNAWGSGVAPS